ncbi:hypothetical protein JCM5296_003951 [Sporobolomyces johnsonii]
MPPVDPGSPIEWAKNPPYSHALLQALQAIPSRQDQHILFTPASHRSLEWKARKQHILHDLTATVFTAGGDETRERKQRESVARRLTQLSKDYSNSLRLLTSDPHRTSIVLANIRATDPYWDALRDVLRDHPLFPPWDEQEQVEPDNDEHEEDPMQDVHYQAVAGPSGTGPHDQHQQPPAAAAPPQPAPFSFAAPHVPPAPAPYSAPAAAAPPRAPLPVQVAPPAAAAAALDDSPHLTSCPKCSLPLAPLSESAATAHMRQCLDGDGATVHECPVCEMSLVGWSREKGEQHVDECCRGGGGTSGGGNGRGKREHIVFIADERSVPKDPQTGEPLECSFCFDEFALFARLARLSCYCCFHDHCVREYWQQPGDKFCPVHRDLDGITEVEMR